jgi:hypothetical protein
MGMEEVLLPFGPTFLGLKSYLKVKIKIRVCRKKLKLIGN